LGLLGADGVHQDSVHVVRFDAMPPAPARKERPMLGGFGSVVGAFGLGGRTSARSPTATSRTPKPMLMAALRVSLAEKPVSPTRTPMVLTTMRTIAAPAVRAAPRRDRPFPGQGVQLQQEDHRTDRRGQGQRMTSRSRLLIVQPASHVAGAS
jgi:hypothetical protein